MLGSDDLVAQARKDADYARSHGVSEDGKLLDDLAAEIERLKAGKAAAAMEIVRLVKERDEAHANHRWAQARLDHAEALAATATRERDEARAEVERLRSERSYIIGNNDGFAEALEQQRTATTQQETWLRAALTKVFTGESGCTLFLDGRNENGSHVIMSLPTSMPESAQDDINESAEEVLSAAEALGFVVGRDHVWTEWRWVEPQIGDEGRVEFRGYWEFVRIDDELTRAALHPEGAKDGQS